MEFFDRVPTYPGRIRLIPVPGQANTFDMIRADEPIVEGTPVDKKLFESINSDMAALRKLVADSMFEISQRVSIGSLEPGSVFTLYENGLRVPFVVLEKDYRDRSRALVIRQSIYKMDTLFNSADTIYQDSKADLWLNNEYINYLDAATRSVLEAIPIPSRISTGNSTIIRKIFFLATREYGISSPTSYDEGDLNYYFYPQPTERRIALYDGVAEKHWTRSVSATYKTGVVSATGTEIVGNPKTDICGYRPAFTLPWDFEVTAGAPNTENVMATAEV